MMARLISLVFTFLLLSSASFAQLNFQVHFESDSFSLSTDQESRINQCLDSLKLENENYRFELIGHTDTIGRKTYNDTLSNDRSNAVLAFLLEQSIESENIFIDFKGFGSPVASNGSDNGRSLNRRVEIKIQTWDEYLLSDLKSKILSTTIQFENEEGYGDSISLIWLCKNAFVDRYGKLVSGEIKLNYQEYRTVSEFIALNKSLQFEENNELYYYQSGGMYLVHAYYNGEPVFLNKDCLNVDFQPNDDKLYDRYIFKEELEWSILQPLSTNESDDSNDEANGSKDESGASNSNDDPTNSTSEILENSAECELTCKERIDYLCYLYQLSRTANLAFNFSPTLNERFSNLDYQGTLHYSELAPFVERDSVFGISVKVKKSNKRTIYFNIISDGLTNKSLIPLLNYSFKMDRNDFEQNVENKSFSNYRFYTDDRTGRFILSFKGATEFERIYVTAYDLEKFLFKKKSKKKHLAILSDYEESLLESEKRFNKNPDVEDSVGCVWSVVRSEFPQNEMVLDYSAWKELFEWNKKGYSKLLGPICLAGEGDCDGGGGGPNRKTTKIIANHSSLGLYNFDIEHKYNGTVSMSSTFSNEDNAELIIKKAYVYSETTGCLILIDPNAYSVDSNFKNCLILFDNQGEIYVVTNSVLQSSVGLSMLKAVRIGDKNMELNDLNIKIKSALDN